jgi:hypothetical protein
MSAEWKGPRELLATAFTPAQVEALLAWMGATTRAMGEGLATRDEVERLRAALGGAAHEPARPEEKAISDEEIAMIAAAVTAYLGRPVRVRSARHAERAERAGPSPWALQGRVTVMASHALPRRDRGGR